MVLLTPLLTFILFAAWQAALWNHARAEARSAARSAAALVARSGLDADAIEATTEARLASRTDLSGADVTITLGPDQVVVVVTGQAPGIVMGTSAPVNVRVALPLEGWQP